MVLRYHQYLKQLRIPKLVLKNGVRQIVTFGVLISLSLTGFSQQPQVYNQFFMNPYIYNPAYAGVEGHAAIFVMYRDQWTQIESAPKISHASFHVPLEGGIALVTRASMSTPGAHQVSDLGRPVVPISSRSFPKRS